MISALNRPHELKMHVKGALRNGVTKDEIREVFLQVAIYCGVPAGVDSFRIAREAFAEVDRWPRHAGERRRQAAEAPKMLIGGDWVEASGGEYRSNRSIPFTGKPWALDAAGPPADVDRAVAAATAAFAGPLAAA